jgi:hypothetical protein
VRITRSLRRISCGKATSSRQNGAAQLRCEIAARESGGLVNDLGTSFCQKPRMSEEAEYRLTLRQADQIRTDIANVESGLAMIKAQLARMPGLR